MPSRLRLALAAIVCMATAALLVVVAGSLWLTCLIVAGCAASGALAWRNADRDGDLRLTVTASRRVVVLRRGDTVPREGDVLDATYVSGAFTAIVWRHDGRWRSEVIPIFADSAPAEARRRVRVWLRYGTVDANAALGREATPGAWLKGDLAR